jgi:hypothetical protein
VGPRELSRGMRATRARERGRKRERGRGWSGQKAGCSTWKEEAEKERQSVCKVKGRVRDSVREFTFVYLPDIAQYGMPTLDSVHRLDAVLSPLNRVLQDLFRIFHLLFQ